MKKPTRSVKRRSAPNAPSASARPRVAGGARAANRAATRGSLVRRARRRVADGYYERPEVVRSLVEVLWDEFFSR